MQNQLLRRRYDCFDRIKGFATTHGAAFAPASRGVGLFAQNTTVVADMQKKGADQLSGTGEYHGGTSAKGVLVWGGEGGSGGDARYGGVDRGGGGYAGF